MPYFDFSRTVQIRKRRFHLRIANSKVWGIRFLLTEGLRAR